MFNSPKYITKGVQEEIPPVLQLFIWKLVLQLPEPKDYLQVFKLSNQNGKQKIIHIQEQPEYEKEYILDMAPVTEKIYVIDDDDHCTMLLAQEY